MRTEDLLVAANLIGVIAPKLIGRFQSRLAEARRLASELGDGSYKSVIKFFLASLFDFDLSRRRRTSPPPPAIVEEAHD